jgi:hypothetical protein
MSTRLDGWTISLPSPLPIRGHNWDDLARVHIMKLYNKLVTSPYFGSLDLTRAGSARSVWNVRENTQTPKNGGKTMNKDYEIKWLEIDGCLPRIHDLESLAKDLGAPVSVAFCSCLACCIANDTIKAAKRQDSNFYAISVLS